MESNKATASTRRLKLKREIREFVLLSVYLYVCFGTLLAYKMAVLGTVGVSFLPLGLPAIKALVLAKFIMLGHAIRLGDRTGSRRVIRIIAEKALLYLVLLIALSVVEEVIAGAFKGKSLGESLDVSANGGLLQIVIVSFIMLLILVPYLASRELDVALGEGRLWAMLFERRAGD